MSHRANRQRRAGRMMVISALLSAVFTPQPAVAITNGAPDGTAHPYVGVLVDDYEVAGYYQRFCTGTLVTPTIMVSAAHCFYGYPLDQVWISFDPTFDAGGQPAIHGTAVLYPDYPSSGTNGQDLAVIHLDGPSTIEPARLPVPDLMDALDRQRAAFDLVGYGSTRVDRTHGIRSIQGNVDPDARHVGSTQGFSLQHGDWVKVGGNSVQGESGTCYGDSGGPLFAGGTNIVLGVSTLVDRSCRSWSGYHRLDTAEARAFLETQGVPLPQLRGSGA